MNSAVYFVLKLQYTWNNLFYLKDNLYTSIKKKNFIQVQTVLIMLENETKEVMKNRHIFMSM